MRNENRLTIHDAKKSFEGPKRYEGVEWIHQAGPRASLDGVLTT
jgi:hypothetical protein